LAKLSGGAAVIQVDAATQTELKEEAPHRGRAERDPRGGAGRDDPRRQLAGARR
jgi:hypothetical protein